MDSTDILPSASQFDPQMTTAPAAKETLPLPLDPSHAESSSDGSTIVEKDDNGFVFYKCRFCGLTFNFMNTLRAHERVHNVDQPYTCGACGESFHFACQLEYHAQQHKETKGYKCDCGRRFFTYTELLYHKHPEDEPPKHMPEIVLPSTSGPAITERDFPAPAFTQEGFEPKHPLKVYSDVRQKPYICEYCSKSYPDSRQLATHIMSHRGEKIFNPRASRYLMGRQGIGYTERPTWFLY